MEERGNLQQENKELKKKMTTKIDYLEETVRDI